MAMEWWRCKHGAPFDPKWISIATRCNDDATQGNAHFVAGTIRPGDVWCVFTALCDRASKSDERGSLEGLDLEDIASGLGFGLEEVEVVFNALKAKGIICDNKITTWDRHQPKREDEGSTERSRKHREKKRDAMQRTATQGDARLDKTREEKIREEEVSVVTRVARTKGTRWPSDAVVHEDWIEDGLEIRQKSNLAPIDLRAEALKFQNYWAAKSGGGATKIDWKKTWINWCMTAKGNSNGRYNGSGQLGRSSIGDTLREIASDISEFEADAD